MALYKGDIELFRKLLQIERQKLKGSYKEKVSFSKLFKEDFKEIFVWVENVRLLLQLVNAYLLLGDAKVIDWEKNEETYRNIDREIVREIVRETDRQLDRHTNIFIISYWTSIH